MNILKYTIIRGNAPKWEMRVFLEDYLPENWTVEWNPSETEFNVVLFDKTGGGHGIGRNNCLVVNHVRDSFGVQGIPFLERALNGRQFSHVKLSGNRFVVYQTAELNRHGGAS